MTRSTKVGAWGLLPCAILLPCAGLLAGCGEALRIEKHPTPVRVQTVQAHSLSPAVRYSANIEPSTRVDLAFKVGGYVEEILEKRGADGRLRPVQAGDLVSRGTVLARVQKTDYSERVEQARSQKAEAEAGLEKARLDLDRARALFQARSLTKPDYDAAQAAMRAGEARVQGASAQLQQAMTALDDCALKAPMDSTLLDRRIERGTLVAPGTPAFVLADVTSVKAVFGVPDLVVETLRPGDSLTVTAEALGEADFKGRVTSISPSADPLSRVFGVETTIPNPRGLLKVGMIASVQVVAGDTGRAVSVPAVPLSAIVRSPQKPDGYAVFVVEGEGESQAARVRGVSLGEVYGNLIGLTEGVRPDERVVVTGASLLSDGEAVRIVP